MFEQISLPQGVILKDKWCVLFLFFFFLLVDNDLKISVAWSSRIVGTMFLNYF